MGMKDESLGALLASLASPTPTPGGGSAGAIAAALSTALSRMVAGLARDKRGYEEVQADLRRIEERGAALQDRLLTLAEDDARAYDAVLAATRMPRSSDAERASRVQALQAAYRRATEVPLEVLAACLDVLELAAGAAEKGNRSATTDAGVAALLGEAAARSAALNVRVNLAAIRDERFRGEAEARMSAHLARVTELSRATRALVEARL